MCESCGKPKCNCGKDTCSTGAAVVIKNATEYTNFRKVLYYDMVEDYNDYIEYTNDSVTSLSLFVDKLSGIY